MVLAEARKSRDKLRRKANCVLIPESNWTAAIMWLIDNETYRDEMMKHHINYLIRQPRRNNHERQSGKIYILDTDLAVQTRLIFG